MTKAGAGYADHPGPNGSRCDGCQFYVPDASKPSSAGTCQIVAGDISPNGYCGDFSPKA